MGLDGLKQTDTKTAALSPTADALINAAKTDGKHAPGKAKRKPKKVFTRVTFSLTAAVDKEVDRLSLIPRTFRSSRSSVVRAALKLLAKQGDEEITKLLKAEQ